MHTDVSGQGSRSPAMSKKMITLDGNEAAARVAHKINEVIAIYPIIPVHIFIFHYETCPFLC